MISLPYGREKCLAYITQDIYISTTVLIAARLHPAIRLHEISESDIDEAWRRALKILETFQSDSLGAQKCVAALKRLHEKVMSRIPSSLAAMPNTGDVRQ
jgi:hypothetical protein